MTRKCYVDIPESVAADVHCFDEAGDRPGLIKPVRFSKDLDAPVSEDLVASLLERERSVLSPLAERRWPLDVTLKESRP